MGGTDEAVRRAREDLAAVHRIAVLENLHEGTWNHFSCKVPGRPGHLLLTPGQTHFSRVTASRLVETDPEGRPVGGGALNQSTWAIHAPIHRLRPDMACALHVHAPHSTALASIEGWRLNERGGQNASHVFDDVGYFDYEGVVTDADEGERMAEALGDRRVLFLLNHGVLVLGETIENAILHLYNLERACQTEALIRMMGGTQRTISLEAAQRNVAHSHEGFGEAGYLEAMKDVLAHAGEDFAD